MNQRSTRTASQPTSKFLECRNPATGEVIGNVPIADAKAVKAAVARARAASLDWGQRSHRERREALIRWRRRLAANIDELAQLIHQENGKTKVDAVKETLVALGHLDFAAKNAASALASRRVSAGIMANFRADVSYFPLGVIGVIGPWNYPIVTPMGSIAYALAAGNTVVFKPSELTSLVGQYICDTAAESLGGADILIAVCGEGATGAALASAEIDKLAFTGSAETGRKVMRAAAERLTPVLLELGGNDPMIVAEDADIEDAAEAAVWGAMSNGGQTCIGIERCYVAAPIYDQFLDRVADRVRSLSVGATDDAAIGAMTSPEQVAIVRDHLEDAIAKGARIVVGGPDAIRGAFIAPTLIVDVDEDMKLMREETFGPVLPIRRVDSVEEAIRLANDSSFGLGSAVFGKKGLSGIADRLRAGMTAVNSALSFSGIPSLPFGGVGLSGFGRIHGEEGLREFSRIKATATKRLRIPFNLMSFDGPGNGYDQLKSMAAQLYGGGAVDRVGSLVNRIRGR